MYVHLDFSFYAVILFLFLIHCTSLNAQTSLPNKVNKTLMMTKDSILLDSNLVIPTSLKIKIDSGKNLGFADFRFDLKSNQLYLLNKNLLGKRLSLEYNSINIKQNSYFLNKKYDAKVLNSVQMNGFEFNPVTKSEDNIGYSSLTRSGSFSRGLSFGNNQDLVLNSYADIQLNGKLADNVDIVASLNDRSIPIQAEGTTANLQSIDQKYIKVSTPDANIQLGDLLLTNKEDNYFLKYNKKVQGINSSGKVVSEKDTINLNGTISLSRGKWNRLTFNGTEGNQGPYRLKGQQGELFIIILSGTEKIYINGKLLTRGQQNDYTIDYNIGEIRFTQNRLITKYDRIVIEYQYADRNYQRYLLQTGAQFKSENWKFNLNLFQENDNKNVPLFGDLRDTDKLILANAGDNPLNAIRSSAILADYNKDKIQYKRIDSNGYGRIYIYTNNADSAMYNVNFIYVGEGKGDYLQKSTLANGKIYQFILPKNGQSLGNYAPVSFLALPEKKQMGVFKASTNYRRKNTFSVETAVSNNDKNTFSNLDDNNNVGAAIKLKSDHTLLDKNKKDSNSLSIVQKSDYEFKNALFTDIERYRSVEFLRTWSRDLSNNSNTLTNSFEHIFSTQTLISKGRSLEISNEVNTYKRGDKFNGFRNVIYIKNDSKKSNFNLGADVTSVSNNGTSKLFSKYQLSFLQKSNKIQPGISFINETSGNSIGLKYLPTLTDYRYYNTDFFIQSNPALKDNLLIGFSNRYDEKGNSNQSFSKFSSGNTFSAKYIINSIQNFNFKIDAKYRSYNELFNVKDNTLLNRIEASGDVLKKVINFNTYYDISSGKEPKRDYIYVQVAKGQGIYTWIDYNKNGLKEFNEFEKAAYLDQAEYIRVITPSNDFTDCISMDYQQTLKLNFDKIKGNGKILNFLNRFYNLFNFRQTNKTLSIIQFNNKKNLDTFFNSINPFNNKVQDKNILSNIANFRNTLFFNRLSAIYGLDYTYNIISSRNFLVSGFDFSKREGHILNGRINLSRYFTLEPNIEVGKKQFNTDYASNKNFYINYIKPQVMLSLFLSNQLTFNFRANFLNQKDTFGQKLSSNQKEYSIESRFNSIKQGVIAGKLSIIKIDYSANLNASESYGTGSSWELLQGLRPGDNYTWQITWNQKLESNLQISISYDGRKSQDTKAIHIGKANITWFF